MYGTDSKRCVETEPKKVNGDLHQLTLWHENRWHVEVKTMRVSERHFRPKLIITPSLDAVRALLRWRPPRPLRCA